MKTAKSTLSLEALLTSKAGFELPASPLQRALVRAADGLPIGDGLSDDEVTRYFGCERSKFGLVAPVLVVVVAGVRGGKSLLSACAAVKSCLSADLSALKPYELPRFAIVAPTVDNATATFRLLVGSIRASKVLSALVEGEPNSDTLTLRRPDGRLVEIVVVAAHRGAVTLRSRWLVGFVLDEVALFGTEASGAAVNAEELLRAGETRLVPGGQAWLISSPFGPSGLLYDLWRAHFGKPGRELVVHAPTRALNPTFPQAQVEAIRQRNPDVAAREYDALWVDADTAFFDGTAIDEATRAAPLEEPPNPRAQYVAAMDAGMRGNSWTLVVARGETHRGVERVVISLARQWTGSKTRPLDPSIVLTEIATVLAPYGVRSILCDKFAIDALAALARQRGLMLREMHLTAAESTARYERVKTLLATRSLELAPYPALANDLKAVRKVANSSSVRADLPRTGDGRHCDFAPPIALVCGEPFADVTARVRRVNTHLQPYGGNPFKSEFETTWH